MEAGPIDVLYDEGPCLVVNKPSGLLTQAPRGIDSLEVQVKEFYRRREGKQPDENIYLGLPHRLDRPVSGAVVLARHLRAAQRLSKQFQDRTVTKVYWAVVQGHVVPEEGTWEDYLHKRHGMAQTVVVDADHPAGKHAVLSYRTVWSGPDCTWLEVELHTGRTHQIRIQAGSRGYPVLGDAQYGSTVPFGVQHEQERDRAIALHARQLAFNHPMTPDLVDITAPLPAAWKELALPPDLLLPEDQNV